jgi:GNAT superfamily N-acetyltransferase
MRQTVRDNESHDDMTALLVRDARVDDADALARLCSQLGYPTRPDAIPGRLARIDDDANARALVATVDAVVVGLTTIHLRYTMNHETPIAQITLLVVDETSRGSGVGRALVERAEAWAWERGSKRLVVTTALQRAGAHAFYERLDFKHTGRRYGKDFRPRDAT